MEHYKFLIENKTKFDYKESLEEFFTMGFSAIVKISKHSHVFTIGKYVVIVDNDIDNEGRVTIHYGEGLDIKNLTHKSLVSIEHFRYGKHLTYDHYMRGYECKRLHYIDHLIWSWTVDGIPNDLELIDFDESKIEGLSRRRYSK